MTEVLASPAWDDGFEEFDEPAILFPDPPSGFIADEHIPRLVPRFSSDLTDIAITPVRAELTNGHLAEYLEQMGRETGGKKVGIVFLVNETVEDRDNQPILEENRLTAEYLVALSQGEMPAEELDIPERYRKIAESVINNPDLEIRVDYTHDATGPGKRRRYLLRLVERLKGGELDDFDTILHLHDVDMRMRSTHLQDLGDAYKENPLMDFNISDYDLAPGTHENPGNTSDITREMLNQLDAYRLYEFGKSAAMLIGGLCVSGTPTLSGRFAAFFPHGRLDPHIDWYLEECAINEDHTLATIMARSRRSGAYDTYALGNFGEVFYLHRARSSDKTTVADTADDLDAETVYTVVSQHDFTVEAFGVRYDLLEDPAACLADLEARTGLIQNQAAIHKGHSPDYLEGSTYQDILEAELLNERQKVARRVARLLEYIRCRSADEPLSADTTAIIAPYVEHYPDSVTTIDEQLKSGQPAIDIAQNQILNHYSFFNPDAPIHSLIARMRALRRYAFLYDISFLEAAREELERRPSTRYSSGAMD